MLSIRDRLTVAEVLATDPTAWEKVSWDVDVSPGDIFFYKDEPDKVYIAERLYQDEDIHVYGYDNGKRIDYDRDVMILFSVSAMLDLISYNCPVQVIYNKERPTVILDGNHVLQSEENEDFVALMWRATIKAHLEY